MQRRSRHTASLRVSCFPQGPLGPNGAPGPPGVKVSLLSPCTLENLFFPCYLSVLKSCCFFVFFYFCLKGNQGQPGIGVQVTFKHLWCFCFFFVNFPFMLTNRLAMCNVVRYIFNPQGLPGSQGSTGLPGPPGPPGAVVGLLIRWKKYVYIAFLHTDIHIYFSVYRAHRVPQDCQGRWWVSISQMAAPLVFGSRRHF